MLKQWFYNTKLYYKFRYYFVRKKAPLSYILWHEILRRESASQGMFQVSIATEDDAALSISYGAPENNSIKICIYDINNKLVNIVSIPLSYKDARRVSAGFTRAFALSRQQIKYEQGNDLVATDKDVK